MNKNILIVGAYSAIAFECAKLYAKENYNFILAGKDINKLDDTANDLKLRTKGSVETFQFEALNYDNHNLLLNFTEQKFNQVDILLVAYGTLPNQKKCETEPEYARQHFDINCTSVINLLTLFAHKFETQKQGTISVISSVAGDRARQSNYLYGTAKGALSLFLQGLRNRFASQKINVNVLTLKPGMTDTPMTAEIPKGILFSSAAKVAEGIYSAISKKKDIAYLPGFWKLIMFIICSIPESVFKKLKL